MNMGEVTKRHTEEISRGSSSYCLLHHQCRRSCQGFHCSYDDVSTDIHVGILVQQTPSHPSKSLRGLSNATQHYMQCTLSHVKGGVLDFLPLLPFSSILSMLCLGLMQHTVGRRFINASVWLI